MSKSVNLKKMIMVGLAVLSLAAVALPAYAVHIPGHTAAPTVPIGGSGIDLGEI